ncbi:MAG: acetyl-CoA carboxylase biotin carboxyl carrier protein [Armatimonadota bacterium]|nr:acetyl-CoA carboxylase biotin carboxyl carrier protein [Armatimonadota bacterium]
MTDRIDFEQVREVARLAEELDLAELEVESPALRVRVRRAAPGPAAGRVAAADEALPTSPPASREATPVPAAGSPAAAGADTDHLEPIVAPMVGTFYRAASPDAPPFVAEGDIVEEGQVVCIIEAMKLFNEIQAEKRGRIVRVLVENASPVEYGQPLFLLDPAASPR